MTDIENCKRQYGYIDTAQNVLIGGVMGAGIGAAIGGSIDSNIAADAARTSAVTGAASAGIGSLVTANPNQDQIIAECLRKKGHKINPF